MHIKLAIYTLLFCSSAENVLLMMQQRRVAAGSGLSFFDNRKNAFLGVFEVSKVNPRISYKIGLGAFVKAFWSFFKMDSIQAKPAHTSLKYS